jgi:hypothetical protein
MQKETAMTSSASILLRTGAALLTMIAAPALAPAVASGQQTLDPVRVTASASARADRLEAEAAALPTHVSAYKKAARLYEQAAEARGFGDPRAATCLRSAAYLRYYSGDRASSVGLLERAADQSAATGDVVSAANAFVDAAIVAAELKQGERALALGRRGEMLMNSPLLDESQRSALRSRVVGEHAVAFAAQP